MPKQPQIRYRENDLAELRRIARNYNAKIERQRRKLIDSDRRYEASQLPQKVSVRDLKRDITTRREFNQELDRMQNFIKTGIKFSLDETTKKSLHATVRDFGSKVDRLSKRAKTQGERAALPEKITEKWLLRNASSKDELKALLKDFRGFLKPGAEELIELPDSKHNIKMTRWQKETMEKYLDSINSGREKELEAWQATEVKYGGKSAGYTQGQARMDQGDYEDFAPMNMYNFSSTYGDIREKFRLMIREKQSGYWEARTELARINYTEKLDRLIGDHPIGKMLLKDIKKLDTSDFKRVLKSEDDLFLLLYELEKHPENYDQLLEEIWNEWNPEKDMYEAMDAYISKKAGEL